MKRIYYKVLFVFAFLCLFGVTTVNAKPITLEQARQKVIAFQMSRGDIRPMKAVVNKKRLAPRRAGSATDYDPYYVFERGNDEGFMIVSGDDQTIDVLGYTDEGTFDYDNLPPGLQDLLNDYAHQIEKIQAGAPVLKAPATHPKVETLMTSKWSQGSPYNDNCPLDAGKRSVTGCVATAMAQILYYNRDKSVTETQAAIPGYTTWTKGIAVQGIAAGAPIDWNNMKDTYGSATDLQKQAVANLMLYCGVSVKMDYTNNSSGAQSYEVVNAIQNYFGYRTDSYLWDYTNDTEADAVMYAEMEAGRAVYVSGANSTVGHAFVCDGYENKRYHINWGWGGQSDGLYYLSNLTPGDGQGIGGSDDGYNGWKNFLINMEPKDYQNMAMKITDSEVQRICLENWDADHDGKFTYGEAAAVTDIGKAFKDNEKITSFSELYYFTSLTTLADDAFAGCTKLATLRLPKSLKAIGARALMDCQSLRQLNLPTTIAAIGADAFNGCSLLAELELPVGLTAVEQGTFKGCTQMTAIDLPITVQGIGTEAFAGCTRLRSFTVNTFHPEKIVMGEKVFNGVSLNTATLSVMQGTKNYFVSTDQWKDFGILQEMRERSGGEFADVEAGKTYYLYHLGTGRYLTMGEAYGTQAVVGTEPMRFKVNHLSSMADGVYYLSSPDTGKDGQYLFRTTTDGNVGKGVKAVFVDGTSASASIAHWTINTIGDKIYTIQLPSNNASYQEGEYLGVQLDHASTAASPTYGVYFDINYAEHAQGCQWHFVLYDEAKEEKSKQAEILSNLISMARKEQKKYADELAVYDNLESTLEQIKAAQSSLRKKLKLIDFADDVARNRVIQFFDTDGDDEYSYKEASELTDWGWLFGFTSFTDLTSFDELQYFTNIPDISGNMFQGCTNLKSVILPPNVEKIYYQAFQNCRKITSINIPDRVNTIGEKCFYNCTSLREVTVENPDPSSISIQADAFEGVPVSQCTLYVPFGSKEAYSEAAVWKKFGNIVEIRGSRTTPKFSPFENKKVAYLYNIGSHRMVAMGEAYGTQSVVANSGRLYTLMSTTQGGKEYVYFKDKKTEKAIFRTNTDSKVGTGTKACFGDGGVSAKAYWTLDSVGDCIYTLQAPSTDENFVEDEYLGTEDGRRTEAAEISYGIFWDIKGGQKYAQWAFITEEDLQAAKTFDNIVAQLKEALAQAKAKALDIEAEQAVYNNTASNYVELRVALTSVREKMGLITFSDAVAETICLNNWDEDGDQNLSFEEAAKVTDIGELFRAASNMKYFEELKYFTSLTEIPENAFRASDKLQTIYLPKNVKAIGKYAFTGCTLLRNLVMLNETGVIPNNALGLTKQITVFLPQAVLADYEADDSWPKSVKRLTEYTGKPVVTAEATRIYGRQGGIITTLVLGAPVEGDAEVSCDLITVLTTPVGTYPIEVKMGTIVTTGVELREGVFTITPAELTVTAKSYTRNTGEQNPEFEITYKGFRNKETAEVLTVLPTATCEATADSPGGVYDIIVSGGEAQNYTFKYVNGTLTVVDQVGITSVQSSKSKVQSYYDLQGRRVAKPTKGMYIKGKKKVMIRN
jgi:hypothetical protein